MKNLLPLMMVLLALSYAHGQYVGTYRCTINMTIRDDTDNASDHCTNNFLMTPYYTDGSVATSWNPDLNTIGSGWKTMPTRTFDFDGTQRLSYLYFKGTRQYRSWDTYHYICRSASGNGDELNTYMPNAATFSQTFTDIVPAYQSNVTVTVAPYTVNMYNFKPDNTIDNTNLDMPSEHMVKIRAYPDASYDWEYEKTSGQWYSLPGVTSDHTYANFKGYDLFTEAEFIAKVKTKTKVRVRVKYQGTVMRTFTYTPKMSAPRILSVEPIMETCYQTHDAQLKLCFSRALYAGELLDIQLNGDIDQNVGANIDSFDANNCYTVTGQDPGAYDILLFGTFAVSGTPNRAGTYNGGTDHHTTTTIDIRPAITDFNPVMSDVHCFGGEDGRVAISAKGGTKSYTAYLVLAGTTVRTISLSESSPNSFTDLPAGDYVAKLKDSNGCDPKDKGDVYTPDAPVDEPDEPVLLTTENAIEPRGFGLHDGYMTVRSTKGTGAFSFFWTDAGGTALTAEPPVNESGSMTSKLSGIGKGIYHARSQDANYALASPATEVNLSGCYDTLTIELDQPPLLEVFVAEHQYVSCLHYHDGAVVAHGTGGRPYLSDHPTPYLYQWFEVVAGSPVDLDMEDSIAANRPSSVYRVMITDRNGITAWSDDFTLVQPDSLMVGFNTSSLLCNGDTNGTSQALVQGGTPGYRYAWSTEETTSHIEGLTDGWYSLIVTDTRECTTMAQTQVKVPNSIAVDSVLTFPTCQGYTDGSIALTITGGKSPYAYAWDHGSDAAVAHGLGEGFYHVRVTDSNGCFVLRDYELKDPALFHVDLGPDRILCKDQTLALNVTTEDPAAEYVWLKDGALFADVAAVDLNDAGTYEVKVTDSKGCKNQDDVVIGRNDAEISASIIVASRAPQGEKIRIANISFPSAERVEWILPEEATVIEETDGYVDVSFISKGAYAIGMTSHLGSCEKTTYSTVRVVDKRELTDYATPDEPYIKQFIVTPNPNDGRFAATVELREAGSFSLLLHTAQGEVITRQDVSNQSFARLEFDVAGAVGNGMYVLQLVTTQGYATFKVVIE